MTVRIPSCENHDGCPLAVIKIEISNFCPKCGGPRGVGTIHSVRSYDGSRWLECDGWTNPCGHVDKYNDVREEFLSERRRSENK